MQYVLRHPPLMLTQLEGSWEGRLPSFEVHLLYPLPSRRQNTWNKRRIHFAAAKRLKAEDATPTPPAIKFHDIRLPPF